jgi:alkyl sulfatase BDS1-like metallo-beta-lactamase superfamily hydrolase
MKSNLRIWLLRLVFAAIFIAIGFMIRGTDLGERASGAGTELRRDALGSVASALEVDVRERVLVENPELMGAIRRGGAFGGSFSRHVAQGMFKRTGQGVDDALEQLEIQEVAPRTWLLRLPIVNAVLFETDEGLVLVDTGMAPAGPAIVEAMRRVSDQPLHTIIYTHGHVDHAFGTWAMVEAGMKPEIVAHEALLPRFERYIRLRGSIARYMSQPLEYMPAKHDDLVWPTRTFWDRLELEIGGEKFVLQHHRGETDDQLYVWVPGRKALASADYYQGFLPNAGNGKRVQRHPEEWGVALREMAGLAPEILLPAHGEAITDPEQIHTTLTVLADALQSIVDQTIAGLNAGLRKDQVFASVELDERLANDPTLEVQYVTPQDISKMVIKRYTGWWDDLPSNWTPVPLESHAKEIVQLAGGIDALVARTRELLETDVQLACHLADWAFLAEPEHPGVQALVIETYRRRILDPASNTMEMLTYIDQMTAARRLQLAAGR